MTARHLARFTVNAVAALSVFSAVVAASSPSDTRVPLTLSTARVTIAGTSNIHDYTASTTNVRVVRLELAEGVSGPTFWDEIFKPGAIESLEVAIAAGSLSSPREGLDKNMYKALKVIQFPTITFRLTRFDGGEPGLLRATGVVTIAGVEREIALNLKTERHSATFTVKGEVTMLMTDYGITPPKALMGMLKTDPKVTVTFETVLAMPLTT
jgi:YceI-like domain